MSDYKGAVITAMRADSIPAATRGLWEVRKLDIPLAQGSEGGTMNCTATTRLTAEECLARLDACPALPRGERLAKHAEQYDGIMVPWGRAPVFWSWLFEYVAPPSVMGPDMWPTPSELRRWAAPVRRLREERRALRESLSRTQTALARSQGELAGATERLGHHLYCAHHDTFNCTMVCASALLGEP